jgi:hypothetical protein
MGPARGHIANSMALVPGLYFMIPIKSSKKTTPFSCKEHFPSSKNKDIFKYKANYQLN